MRSVVYRYLLQRGIVASNVWRLSGENPHDIFGAMRRSWRHITGGVGDAIRDGHATRGR